MLAFTSMLSSWFARPDCSPPPPCRLSNSLPASGANPAFLGCTDDGRGTWSWCGWNGRSLCLAPAGGAALQRVNRA